MENRRTFVKNLGASLAAMPLLAQAALAQEDDWVVVNALVRVKKLWEAKDANNARANLVQLRPGFTFSHTHIGYEITYVLDGMLVANNITYGAGAMVSMSPGSCHAGTVGPQGATVLVLETLNKTNVAQCLPGLPGAIPGRGPFR